MLHWRPKKQDRLRNERGVQLVELALVLPVMFFLLASIAEFGRYFYTFNTLSKATRAAARHLSGKPFTETEKTKARNIAVCGNPTSCSGITPILSGLSSSNIEITSAGGTLIPKTVKVRIINYQYQPIFNLANMTGIGTWQNVGAAPSTTMRYMLEN